YQLPVSMMNCQANFMASVAAAIPNHIMMEVADPGREHCLHVSSWIEDGHIVLSEEPGFGIGVHEPKLRELQQHPPAGRGRFPFPRREGAGRYLVSPDPTEIPWPRGS